jgi:hypothetical protein
MSAEQEKNQSYKELKRRDKQSKKQQKKQEKPN